MAKFVVAGRSDCPYFARVELLGDRLAKNLKKFNFHKIMVQPDEWEQWLQETCKEKGWQFSKSPIVWRELIDRGGKGVLIGGANEFQEYVKAYYDLESEMNSFDMRTISSENKITKDELDDEDRVCKAMSKPLHVCITNASSPICYHLLSSISSGDVLGPKTEMTIHLVVDSVEELETVQGTSMEAEDLAHHLLRGVHVHTTAEEAFENCSVIILLDEVERDEGETMKEWLTRNKEYFTNLAVTINEKALSSCKVLVSGRGPINFNTGEIIKNAPALSRHNIVAVPSVVENHAKSVIGERLTVNPAGVVNLIVWGNVNSSRYIDLRKCRVHNYDGAIWGPYWYSVDAPEMVHDNKWILKEFPDLVATREEKVSVALQHTTCMSEANAISTLLKYWWRGSPSGQYFSLGVLSEGWYGVPEGLVFSYPVVMDPKGYWYVVQDSEITPEVKEGITNAIQDLIKEQNIQSGLVSEEPVKEDAEAQAGTTEEEGAKTPAGEATEAAADGGAEQPETAETAPASAEGEGSAPAGTEGDAAGGPEAEVAQETAKDGDEAADESGAVEGGEGEGQAETEDGAGETNEAEATEDAPATEE